MKNTLAVLISLCIAVFPRFPANCQSTYFNVSVDFGASWGIGSSVLTDDTAYYAAGVTGPVDKITIVQFNTYGNLGWIKNFGKTGESWHSARAGLSNILGDGSLLTGWIYNADSTYGLMMKFDEVFDSAFSCRYSNMVNLRMAFYSGIETIDQGFVFTGENTVEAYNADLILLKTNSIGTEQWRILYGYNNCVDRGWSIIQTPDSGLVIGGYYYQPGLDNSGNPFIVKFDQYGNFQWRKNLGGPYMDNKAIVCLAHDSTIVVFTNYSDSVYDYINEIEYGRIHLLKYSLGGSLIWEKKYDPGKIARTPGNIIKSSDGGLVCCGSVWPNDGNPNDNLDVLGWMFKINESGDSIWYREYKHFSSDDAYNLLYDLKQTNDNGFVACGQTTDLNTPQKFWVLKVDSLGCNTAGCDTTVGVPEEPFLSEAIEIKERLEIWPNPARGHVRVSWLGTMVNGQQSAVSSQQSIVYLKLVIYDIWGRKILEKPWPEGTKHLELDVGTLPDGLYLCVLNRGQEQWLSAKLLVNHD